MNAFQTTLIGRHVALEPMAGRHREALRAACAADPEVWEIYPYSMLGAAFDAQWDKAQAREAAGQLARYAVMRHGACVGITCVIAPDWANKTCEIGGTYYRPDQRGGVVNPESKMLLMDHIFDQGVRRIQFRVDAINARSRAAMVKMGATFEGILREDVVTWTGRVRSTCVFSVLAQDWPQIRQSLSGRISG